MHMFPQSVVGGIEISGKCITWNWLKIMLHGFLDIREVTGIISAKQLN